MKMRISIGILLVALMAFGAMVSADESAAERNALDAKVWARVEEMKKAIGNYEAEGRQAKGTPDMTQAPGRAEFISWAMGIMPAAEKAGLVWRDACSLVDWSDRKSERFLQVMPGLDRMFRTLGRLKAVEASEMLALYVSSENSWGGTLSSAETFESYKPAFAALVEIGKPAVPALIANIKRTDDEWVGWWSACVVGTILCERGPEYYKGQIEGCTDAAERERLKAAEPQILERARVAASSRKRLEERERKALEAKEKEQAAEVFE